MRPIRAILQIQDVVKWKKSKAYKEYINFIKNLSDSVIATKLTDQIESSEAIQKILNVLGQLIKWVDETPPIEQPQRFGNKAFKTWLTKVKENATDLIKTCIADETQIEEICTYFVESFGNEIRIDYGTGHEMAFTMFLMCLFKIDALKQSDSKACVLLVFNRYLELARKLQKTYNMEPAGSHGVWSLDDFQFLAFYFGSAQLMNQNKIEPRHFVEIESIEKYQNEYMFFGCLKFITTVKHGPFAEHSNQLWNISSVPTWSKVNSGLLKMYTAEVLDKFPVVQHVLFGNFIDISPA